MAEPRVQPANPHTAYERSDWPIGRVGLVALAVVGVLVIAPLALVPVFPGAVLDVDRRLAVEPPPPRLQVDPVGDLARFRADEDKRLNTYYWVDRERGIVHIPIDQAIRKVVEQGIDGFPQGAR